MNARLTTTARTQAQNVRDQAACATVQSIMTITTLLVDLDGTLYDITSGYEEHVRQIFASVRVYMLRQSYREVLLYPSSGL